MFFHFFYSVVCGTGGEGHEGERRVLIAGGGHAGAIGYKHILAGMKLIPFVEEGGLGIAPHPDAAHLVDIEAGVLVVVKARDVFAAGGFQHFGALGNEVGGHLIVVIVVAHGGDELWDAPGIFLVGAEPDVVVEFGDGLALHAHGDPPGARLGECVFVGCADAILLHVLAAVGAEVAHIAPLETEVVVFLKVAEVGDEDFGGAAAVVIFIGESIEEAAYVSAVVVKHDVVTEEAVVVAEAVGEAGRFAVEQDEVGVEAGGIDEDDARVIFGGLFGLGVYDSYAFGFTRFVVIQDLGDDAVGLQGEVAGALGPGDRGRIGVEVAAEGAASFAHAARLALSAALLDVDGFGFGEMSAAADDYRSVRIVFHDLVRDMSFGAVHFPGWKEFTVGELDESIFVAADAGEFLDIAIPGGEVVIADGPGRGDAVTRRAFEFEWAPALRLPGPEEAFAADLVAPDPVEWFLLDVGMCLIGYEEMFGGFAIGVAAAEDGVVVEDVFREAAAMREFPGGFCGRGIVFEMDDGAAAFEQERFEAVFAEFFCGPTAADAGADDDCVVLVHVRKLW